MHRMLRIAVLVPLFLVVLTPLMILPGAPFPYVTAKAIWFRFMIELALLPWIVLLAWRKVGIPWTKTTVFLVAFVILALISDFHAAYPMLAIFSNVERMEGGISYVFLLVWYLMMASVMGEERLRRAWLWSLLGVGIALEALAFAQWGPNREQPISTLGNASYVGQFCAMMTFLALSLRKEVVPRNGQPPKHDKYPPPATILALGAAFFSILATFAAQSRGGLLALAAGGVVYWAGSLGGSRRGLVVITLASCAAGLLAYLDTPLWLRLMTLGAWDNRPDIWATAVEMARAAPILGWGQDHFRYAFDQFTHDQGLLHHVDRAHNLILDRLVQGGILGLYAWFGFLLAVRRTCGESTEKSGNAALRAFLVAYVVSDLTLFDTLPSYMLLIGMAAITTQRARAPYRIAKKPAAPVRPRQREVNVAH